MKNKLCEEAINLITGDRRGEYGSVEESFTRIAKVWSGILLIDITAEQVALCMAGLKLCREANLHKQDNIVDLIGYSLLLNELQETKETTRTDSDQGT